MHAMPRWTALTALLGLCLCLLGGCANVDALKSFSASTQEMTTAVRNEMQQAARLCEGTADLRVLLDEAERGSGGQASGAAMGKRLKAACAGTGRESTALQSLTVDTLQAYGTALGALTEDKRFELRTGIEATGKKLAALSAADGAPGEHKAKVGAATQLLAAVGDALSRQQRQASLQALLDAEGAVLQLGQSLRGWFVRADGQGLSGYQTLIETAQGLRNDVSTDLDAFISREPIRVAELRRTLPPDKAFADRDARQGGAVPKRMAMMIDQWLALVPGFREAALQPRALARAEELAAFGKTVRDTREAIEKAGF
jgi:hypothetical protein